MEMVVDKQVDKQMDRINKHTPMNILTSGIMFFFILFACECCSF